VNPQRSPWTRPLAIIGIFFITLWVLIAIFAPLLAPYDPIAQDFPKFLEPSGAHWMGTDQLGRDEFSRVLYGARISIPLALLLVALSTVVGATLGAVAGYFGRWADGTVMRLADLVFAFPGIILAMAAAAALGPSLQNAVLALVIVMWPSYARVVRSLILGLRETEFVASSRLLGSSARRTLAVDLRPNAAGQVLVLAALEVGNAVLLLSGLSFLGLGLQPPLADWGALVRENIGGLPFAAPAVIVPSLAIASLTISVNLLIDNLPQKIRDRDA
jgi:peptide/nickel transport system permease protein